MTLIMPCHNMMVMFDHGCQPGYRCMFRSTALHKNELFFHKTMDLMKNMKKKLVIKLAKNLLFEQFPDCSN